MAALLFFFKNGTMSKFLNEKMVFAGILLLSCGIVVAFLFDLNPLVKTRPEDRSLNQLFVDMGVEIFPNGTPPLDFSLPDLSGADVAISGYRGKVVLLNFWATWCPTCVVEMPSMEKLHLKLKDKNFALVTVSIQDSALQVKRFFLMNKLTFTALLDLSGKTVPVFGIREIPTTLILDKTGKVVGRVIGSREWDSRESVAMFENLIGETWTESSERSS